LFLKRRSVRIKDYDYSRANVYFVTICAYKQKPIFGNIKNDKVLLTDIGKIVDENWLNIPTHYDNVLLDEYIIMPDHLHGLIVLSDSDSGRMNAAPTGILSLGGIINHYKAGVTRQANKIFGNASTPIWQRNYYEHVVRNESELGRIREYIAINPLAANIL
jgi:putative transposase